MSENQTGLIWNLIKDVYGFETRKGLPCKFAFCHSLDTLNNIHYEAFSKSEDQIRLSHTALLHDILEDSGFEPEELQSSLKLDDQTIQLLRLLSRKHNNRYPEKLIECESAFIVKLSDLLANLTDLETWLRLEGRILPEIVTIINKYYEEWKTLSKHAQKHKNYDDEYSKEIYRLYRLVSIQAKNVRAFLKM